MIVKSKDITKTFKLKCDESGEAWLSFRQATMFEDMMRGDYYTQRRTEYPMEKGKPSVVVENLNPARAKLHEIRICLTGAGGFVDEVGKDVELFKFAKDERGFMVVDMSEKEFEMAFAKFPSEFLEEAHDHLLTVNSTWGKTRAQLNIEPKHGEEEKTPLGESKATSSESQ